MSIKKEDCVLILMLDHNENKFLVRELIKSGKKVRLAISDLKNAKSTYFDIWERLDAVYPFEVNLNKSEIKQKLIEMIGVKNGNHPNSIIFISRYSEAGSSKLINKNNIKLDFKYIERNIKTLQVLKQEKHETKLFPTNIVFINCSDRPEKENNLKLNISFRNYLNNLFERLIQESSDEFNCKIIRTPKIKDKINDEQGVSSENLNSYVVKILEGKEPCQNNNLIVTISDDKSYLLNPFYQNIPFMTEFNKFISFSRKSIYFQIINERDKFYIPKPKIKRELIKDSFIIGLAFSVSAFALRRLVY